VYDFLALTKIDDYPSVAEDQTCCGACCAIMGYHGGPVRCAWSFGRRKKTPMAPGASGGAIARWPFHSTFFWCGLLAGVGVGLLLGAALVELEVLTLQRKAWVSVLGAVLVGVGGLVGARGRSGSRGGAEPGAAHDRGPM
jgi:hypothetical protein